MADDQNPNPQEPATEWIEDLGGGRKRTVRVNPETGEGEEKVGEDLWRKPPGGPFNPPVDISTRPSKPEAGQSPFPGLDTKSIERATEVVTTAWHSTQEFYQAHQNEIMIGVIVAGALLVPGVAAPVFAPMLIGYAAEFLGVALAVEAGALAASLAAPSMQRLGTTLAAGGFAAGFGLMERAEANPYPGDPIILDLNGDGAKTTNIAKGGFFDHDNNGFAEATAWVDENDGMLVRDLNQNGSIDNGTELFGNNTLLPNGTRAHDGYQALAAYDSNSDGTINSQDAIFNQLQILKGDGTLHTLADLGIKSLDVSQITLIDQVDENRNVLSYYSSYTKNDNSTAQMAEFFLLNNTVNSIPLSTVPVPPEIELLPNASGSGNVYELHQAMAQDTSNTLKGLVESFIASSSEARRNVLIDQILAKWSGVTPSTNLQNGNMLLRTHVQVVEKFEGHHFQGNPNDLQPFIGTLTARYISQEYYQLAESLYGKLMAQTQLADYFSEITWAQDPVNETFSLNLDSVFTKLQDLYATDSASAIQVAGEFSRALVGLRWASVSNYADFYADLIALDAGFKFALDSAGKQFIQGTSNADLLGSEGVGAWDVGSGQWSRDDRPFYLNGGAGNDTLQGSYSHDILVGGTGNDTLRGYDGNDAYYFNLGDGQDTIIEGNAFRDNFNYLNTPTTPNQTVTNEVINTGFDSIFFGAGISANDLTYSLNGSVFTIGITGTTDKITMDLKSIDHLVEQLVFDDGTIVKTTDILHGYLLEGTAGNDNLSVQNVFTEIGQRILGYDGNDNLSGSAGNDTYEGGNGNDTVYDAGGNNLLDGGNGNDSLYAQHGNDTVLGGEGDDDIYGFGGNDSLDGGNGTDSLRAGDGNDTLLGGAGNDSLNGGNGNDRLNGNAGNDSLFGENGNDAYSFEVGSGQDVIDERSFNGKDSVMFGEGLSLSNAIFSGFSANSLLVKFVDNPNDQLQILGQYSNGQIETFKFDDATLTSAQVLSRLQTLGTEGSDNLQGSDMPETIQGFGGNDYVVSYEGNDTVYGGNGNDTIGGGGGNDSLYGDAGNDSIDSGSGNDTLIGGIGNDTLQGSTGNDTYVFDAGFGYDLIDESETNSGGTAGGNDTVRFNSDLSLSQAVFGGDNSDNSLTIRFLNEPGSLLKIKGGLQNQSIENFQFSDGTLSFSQIVSRMSVLGTENDDQLAGTFFNDSMYGYGGNDTLGGNGGDDTIWGGNGNDALSGSGGNDQVFGEAGNDTLDGNDGNDILNGASGNDSMLGGYGNDTYIFSNGSDTIDETYGMGLDTVDFGNIVSENVSFSGDLLDDVYVRVNGDTANQLKIVDQLTTNTVETFHFADVDLTATDILNRLKVAGGSGDDWLLGSNYNESILGYAGSDTINAYGGSDTLDGGDGVDTINAGAGNDLLIGGAGNDSLKGESGDDTYYFAENFGFDTVDESLNNGNDSFSFVPGLSLSNALFSADGANHLYVKFLNDPNSQIKILGGGYNGAIENFIFADGTLNLNQALSRLKVTGTENADNLYGSQLSETILGYGGNDNISGYDGNDTIDAGAGDDTVYGDGGNDSILGGTGNDYINGWLDNDFISGGDGQDSIEGAAGNDTLYGDSGADTLIGGAGNDQLYGGDGNDLYRLAAGFGQDSIDEVSGNGFDIVALTDYATSNAIFTTNANDDLIISFNNSADQLHIVKGLNQGAIETFQFGNGILTLAQVSSQLQIRGTSGDDNLTGSAFGESLLGYAGNDTLNGNGGADTFIGSTGNDLYIVDSTDDVVIENANEGTDSVQSSVSYTLGAELENLTLTGAVSITGTGNALDNVIIGNTGNNSLTGNSGADTLDGGAGSDTLIGGLGNDLYVVDSTSDVITENLNEGLDSVQASASYTLGANVENLVLTGTTGISGTGNTLVNQITGNIAENSLAGDAGNDTLTGLEGDDTLDGGIGNDSLVGGLGNDVYVVDSLSDVVVENTNEGTDTVQSSLTYTLGSNLENLTLTGSSTLSGTGNGLANLLTGNSGANTLTGAAGDDTLNGGAGVDSLVGGIGNDVYIVDSTSDVIVENSNEGTDRVESSVTTTLGNNLENLTLTGIAALSGTGNSLDNYLTGNSGANTLSGSSGNDTLDGGLGNDSLAGGAGNDVYVVDSNSDVVSENLLDGTDTVQASVTYTLGSNLENLNLTGNSAISGTGNLGNNVITGNSAANTLSGAFGNDTLLGEGGNDTLDGGVGNDSMAGGLGNDNYIVDSTSDVILENAGEGIDLVESSLSITLGSNVENLTLTAGLFALTGTGNELDNVLTGNTGANTLTGAAGNDTLNGGSGADNLIGGTGNDLYIIDSTSDAVVENAGEGSDTVQSSITTTLGANVENLTLTGTSAINGTGNTLNNALSGNAGSNTLTAGSGNDTLSGDLGNDSLYGDAGNDLFRFGKGDGQDRLFDSSGTDTLRFESNVMQSAVAVFQSGSQLQIGFTDSSGDLVTLNNVSDIERIELNDGHYLTNNDINQIIQDMSSYATNNGVSFTSLNDVENNQNLMNIVNNSWHAA